MTSTSAGNWRARLIGRLETLRETKDRAALAALRRGLGKPPGAAPEQWPVLLPHLPDDIPRQVLDRCCLVAALFALHPDPWDGAEEPWNRNLGASFRRLDEAQRRPDAADPGPAPGIERRLLALLQSDVADLPDRLRHAVTLLRGGGIPVHWGQLFDDLGRWSDPNRRVQRGWAKAFWGGRALDGIGAAGVTADRPAAGDEPDTDDEE